MIVNTISMLNKAKDENYAVGAFNFSTIEQLKSILMTANKLESPVILSASMSSIDFIGIELIVSVVKTLEPQVNIDFALHLDHATTYEQCKNAIDAGFSSVMIDTSKLPILENIAMTKKVVSYATDHNISVESELGIIGGQEDNIVSKELLLTKPDEAELFARETGINSLAISIGTSHGAYKFKEKSELDFQRLADIKNRLSIPLVLHGASSLNPDLLSAFKNSGGQIDRAVGVSHEMLRKAVDLGINKINVDTDLRIAFTTGIRESLKNKNEFNLRNYIKSAKLRVENEVEYLIKNVLRSYKKNMQ